LHCCFARHRSRAASISAAPGVGSLKFCLSSSSFVLVELRKKQVPLGFAQGRLSAPLNYASLRMTGLVVEKGGVRNGRPVLIHFSLEICRRDLPSGCTGKRTAAGRNSSGFHGQWATFWIAGGLQSSIFQRLDGSWIGVARRGSRRWSGGWRGPSGSLIDPSSFWRCVNPIFLTLFACDRSAV